MDFKFDKVYYRVNEDGLLSLVFKNLDCDLNLYFENNRFSILSKKNINKELIQLQIESGVIEKIVETEDFDYLIQLSGKLLVKIHFFPNENYSNGVEQVLRIYTSENRIYEQLQTELNESDQAMIF